MLQKVQAAQYSEGDNRPILTGIHIKFDSKTFTAVATDGKRLSRAVIQTDNPNITGESHHTLPKKAIEEILRNLGEEGQATVTFTPRAAIINIQTDDKNGILEKITITTKIVEGNYPNYNQVIPRSYEKNIKISTAPFQQALPRVSLLCSNTNHSVKVILEANLLTLHTQGPDIGTAKETITIPYQGNPFTAHYNPSYLLDLCKTCPEEVTLFFREQTEAAMFTTSDKNINSITLIMPVKRG
jgi:DNA polymerase-3 subunit beta